MLLNADTLGLDPGKGAAEAKLSVLHTRTLSWTPGQMNHSHTMDRFCHRLDMLGIGIFIVGDIVLGVYIIFWCETTLRSAYWSMVSRSLYAPLFPSSDL